MKIERLIYGMQTADGKILMPFSEGVRDLLTQKSIDHIRMLKPHDSRRYLWFKTEQTLAYSVIVEVQDKRSDSDGHRTWVQNQTFLMNIHDFFRCSQQGVNPFQVFEQNLQPEMEVFPEVLSPLNV